MITMLLCWYALFLSAIGSKASEGELTVIDVAERLLVSFPPVLALFLIFAPIAYIAERSNKVLWRKK